MHIVCNITIQLVMKSQLSTGDNLLKTSCLQKTAQMQAAYRSPKDLQLASGPQKLKTNEQNCLYYDYCFTQMVLWVELITGFNNQNKTYQRHFTKKLISTKLPTAI